ncbi:MAG: ATP-dependent DNA helicase [Rhodocyclaceae bacterium]
MLSRAELAAIFAQGGALARAVPGYRVRAQQLEMAQAIAEALADNSVLVAEAGTGTGKTFAYLVPALLAGGKLIVSTGTKTLQDQLFGRDLPCVRAALGVPLRVALLKGRANYVCHYHLERTLGQARMPSREAASQLRAIARYARTTHSGDKAGLARVPEDSPAWPMVTSTRENCLGQECPHYKDCFVIAARREAMAADVVVVNHHLFFADVMLRDEGVAELLPACNAVIFDEAHALAETASAFFGESVSTAQLADLARDARNEAAVHAADFPELGEAAHALERASRELRLAVGGENARLAARAVEANPDFGRALGAVAGALERLAAALEAQAERSAEIANCARRAAETILRLARWRGPGDEAWVRWVEVFTHAAALNATPLAVGEIFRRQREGHPRAWIFTSATLAVGEDFSHYCGELGLEGARTGRWGSPFDYEQHALLYVPRGLPDPNAPEYAEAVAAAAWPPICASGGGAFVLCTSLRAMRRIHEWIAARIAEEGRAFPLLLQGESSKSELLARFRAARDAVLVASQSFWEGVDVRGRSLRLVVIDRLPFQPPDDPVLAARIESLRRSGRNPFLDYQLPRAALALKQGAGRLIRDEADRGVLMICDPRLVEKPYGSRIWRSLPPMRRTRGLEDVLGFFAAQEESTPAGC